MPLVAVIMGSKSDWGTMRQAAELLEEFGVEHECRVLSAHRTPAETAEYAGQAESRGIRGKRRNAQISSSATRARSSPLVRRCVNSMIVEALGECCVTVPLHSGQWFPQPAPEPVARTNAPHNTTPRL